ncbi:MFS transporter [Xenorhabdus poinarii]|nr:MFS transporter [Xenorhabdus poinarii]
MRGNTSALLETESELRPISGLFVLAMTSFIAILTVILLAGLLPQIGMNLSVLEALAGQLALSFLLAAIPLTTATRNLRQQSVSSYFRKVSDFLGIGQDGDIKM